MIFVKPNYDEFWNTFLLEKNIQKENVSGIIATKEKMKELKKEFGVELIITRGIKPILYTTETNDVQEIPVELGNLLFLINISFQISLFLCFNIF